jgi:hypothetical protein
LNKNKNDIILKYSRFEQHNDDSNSSVSPIIAAADVIIDFFIFDLDFGIF